MKSSILRFVRALPLLIVLPVVITISIATLALTDILWRVAGRRRATRDTKPDLRAASLVIPNWNGLELLKRFLPSWVDAIAAHPGSEIIVVDNGSTDGSAAWLSANYPGVRVLALPRNLGFGGGSNAGFRAARNDVVVLLNSDMRVEPDFLAPLLDGFTDETVFAVSCQIFLGDLTKRREETGLTEGWWQDGMLRVGHREDSAVNILFPCFYGGGGSCAFDRRKFLELGGFDELFAPFYLEDTDLGFMAWKRGWKVLYQPASIVYHEHRGTIGRRFSAAYIESVLQKNFTLFAWKNIHDWSRLAGSFVFALGGSFVSAWSGNSPGRASALGVLRAFGQIPAVIRSRWRALSLAVISDSEVFLRSRPAFFHDRFSALTPEPVRPRVLFVSPYSIYPPTHGGAVFMYYTVRELARTCDVHAIVMLDYEGERAPNNEELSGFCQSVEFVVRRNDRDPHLASITPHAIHEFQTPEMEWLIQRQILLHRIDILQLEYTALGQYARRFNRLVCALFEHDVYFQSIGRALPFMRSPLERLKARFEYIRAIRFELSLLPRCDEIQVCTLENKRYLESFLPALAPRIDAGMRAGVDASLYAYPGGPRRPRTMLFLGSFRHTPNQVALDWFTREVLPLVLAGVPDARLLVAGSEPPPRHAFHDPANAIDLLGFVDNIQPLFETCAVFVCPIRSGSGVRVKLLEAFASGIPVVSTTLGAEGLARNNGEFCALADDPRAFADSVIRTLNDPVFASEIASRARREVETNWDMAVITRRLIEKYRALIFEKRSCSEKPRLTITSKVNSRDSITAVIPVHNRADLLVKLLDSINAQTIPFTEVIVIDNGSTDGAATLALARGCTVIGQPRNIGFARAVNLGWRAASSSQWIAILNSDVTLDPNWLERLLSAASGFSFATGTIFKATDRQIIDGTYDLLSRSGCAWRAGYGEHNPDRVNQGTIAIAPGTACLFRRDVLEHLNGFDEEFDSYLEDVDLGLRCVREGYEGIYVPDAVAWHQGSATLGRWNARVVRQISRNQLLLIRRHYDRELFRACVWPIVAGQLLWGLVALRHGALFAWLGGKCEALKSFRLEGHPSPRLRAFLAASELEIRHRARDPYWRWYFRLTSPFAAN